MLVVATLFAYPNRLGLKIDPAFYGTLSKQILSSGEFWPLRLSKDLFPVFYAHPPGAVWLMTPFVGLFPEAHFGVHLFSRLCVLVTYLLLVQIVHENTGEGDRGVVFGRAGLAVFLLHSWMQWLKYAGVGQLEGPESLALLASFLFFARADRFAYVSKPALAFCAFCGFLFKGVFYLPLLAVVFAWGIAQRRLSLVRAVAAATVGVALALGLLFSLDLLYGTEWTKQYFFTQVYSMTVEGFDAYNKLYQGGADRSANLLQSFWTGLKMETHFGFVWSVPLWGILAWCLIKKRWTNLGAFSAAVYLMYLGVVLLSSHKLPHWTVPSYPFGALALAVLLPHSSFTSTSRPLSNPHLLRNFFVFAILLMAILPYPIRSKYGRGEDWATYAPLISQHGQGPLIILKHPATDQWANRVYSAYYLGGFYPVQFVALQNVGECKDRQTLLAPNGLQEKEISELGARGWKRQWVEAGQLRLYTCD
ncbi:MAG: hypothetical protein KDD39_00760 [Bdellovibrionales bacterium]|nr:hypothetical protein [Bdellovibrionales bacterium]